LPFQLPIISLLEGYWETTGSGAPLGAFGI
jgi:hypothetical protein